MLLPASTYQQAQRATKRCTLASSRRPHNAPICRVMAPKAECMLVARPVGSLFCLGFFVFFFLRKKSIGDMCVTEVMFTKAVNVVFFNIVKCLFSRSELPTLFGDEALHHF